MSKSIINNLSEQVYNCCSQIPLGYVSTYKNIANFLNISPRVVGQTLKRNPYAPKVPCHRVIASTFFIGGFQGEWGEGKKINLKKERLKKEGIFFDSKGYLVKDLRDKVIFKNFEKNSS
ncbi:MAG: Methylated-DNA--protein-cysteine methyltransferase [Mycoplasmataceae bacterium]|nr:Methylated-DNA--protein-cysteine methyltransferase [Mycoplasmataceae bacterium]WNE41088.1 MAG: Methylated-DNA--protein-cysteine methyltransferase [Mycoplasmataceae bacterium]